MDFARIASGRCRCIQICTLQTDKMQIPHVAITPRQIGRQLAELDQEIHAALKDIRRNLVELEEVSRMGTSDRASQTGRKFADVLKESLGEGGASTER